MKKKILLSLTLSALVLPVLVFGQVGSGVQTAPNTPVMGAINKIIDWVFYLLLFVAVLYLLIAAFYFITANGDADKIKTARTMILYALIGVAVAILAKGLVLLVGQVFGVNLPIQ